MNINFTPFPELKTLRLSLRRITAKDSNELFILKSDERLLKHYNAKPRTYEEALSKLDSLNEDISRNESITWGIALKADNKLIGSVCFWNICEDKRSAEIGYELMFEWQGKGIMDEAVKAVIDYGFNEMKLKTIEAVPDPGNIKSVKLLERNLFKREAVFTESVKGGKALKRVVYTLENDRL